MTTIGWLFTFRGGEFQARGPAALDADDAVLAEDARKTQDGAGIARGKKMCLVPTTERSIRRQDD
jgi:hypothetical protein